MPTLAVFRGEELIDSIELKGETIRIGRVREKNNLVLADDGKGVSRTHAEIRYETGTYLIFDLKSANGTWIDGKRINRAPMRIGRDVAIGPYRLVLRESELSASGETPPPANTAERHEPTKRLAVANRDLPQSSNQRLAASGVDVKALFKQPPVMIGGGATLVALAVAAVLWLLPSRAVEPAPTSAGANVSESGPGETPSQPPLTPTPEEIRAERMRAAREWILKDDIESIELAVTQFLDEILKLNAEDQEAKDLRQQAESKLAAIKNKPEERPKPGVVAKLPAKPDDSNVPRLQGESDEKYWSRVEEADRNYKSAVALFDQRSWEKAERAFQAIDAEFLNGYKDVRAYLFNIRNAKQQGAVEAVTAAEDAERKADPETARSEYAKAIALGHPEAVQQSKAFEERAKQRGMELRKEGMNYANNASNKEYRSKAVTAFQHALRWLRAGNPNRIEVEGRLEKLNPKN